MADGHNQLARFFSVLVVILFNRVACDIDDGSFDENDFRESSELYDISHVRTFK